MVMTSDIVAPNINPPDLAVEPIERASTIPSAWYTDPAFHRLDNESLFKRTWQGVGFAAQVRNRGDYFRCEVAGHPVLVVRGEDGVLRAFYNVCKHRGGPVATSDGCAKTLTCQYHGWTYRLDGTVRGVPKFDRVELFNKEDYGLHPVAVDEWEGLVFVNLADNPKPLAERFSGIKERIAPIDLKKLEFYETVDYEIDCNWKVYIDNYMEGYHVPFVHPELCQLYEFQRYQTELHEQYSLQWAPLTADENIYSSGGGEAFYYFVFPNFMLNILPGRLQTNVVTPLSHDRTLVRFWYFYEDVTSAEADRRIKEDIEFSDKVQLEDVGICEHVQQGLLSPAYDVGRFSVDQEQGVYDFQRRLKQSYQEWQDAAR